MVRDSQNQRDYDISSIEKFMALSQRTDKLEVVFSELSNEVKRFRDIEVKEFKTLCDVKFREESQKGQDWIKILVVLVIISILTLGALWYSSITRMTVIENLVIRESDIVKKFVLKEDLQKTLTEGIRSHEKDYHIKLDGSKKVE